MRPACLLHWVFVRICKSVVSGLLFFAMSSWFSVLWIFPVMSQVRKKGAKTWPTFSSPIVSLTLYPIPSSSTCIATLKADTKCRCSLYTHGNKDWPPCICQWPARRYSCYHKFANYFHHDIIDCSPSHAFRTNQKATRTSETLVNFYQTTRRYNLEDSHLRTN
jgi:hypothetical protein